MASLKHASDGDIAAEFERAMKERWPGIMELLKDPTEFDRWLAEWLRAHDLDESRVPQGWADWTGP